MKHRLTRREWMASAGGIGVIAAATGCGRNVPITPSAVSVVRAPAYDQLLYETVRRVFEEHRLDVRGRSVVLKPNLVEFEPGSSINTNPLVVHAAMEAVRAMGAAEVRIAEGPGHRRNTLDLADAAGYFRTIPDFEDRFTDLNLDNVTKTRVPGGFSGLRELYLPNTALGADLLISIPKMKTHHWVGATLSMKNLFGTVPGGVYGWPKNPLHWAGIAESVADLHSVYPRVFALVDGIVGMEGNGPIQGTPKQMGVVVAGADLVAVDATCCRLMQIEPLKVEYLRLATRSPAFHMMERNIRQIGESPLQLSTPFELPPGFSKLRMEVG
jgi:uncharacterized protein (DUF362 family)